MRSIRFGISIAALLAAPLLAQTPGQSLHDVIANGGSVVERAPLDDADLLIDEPQPEANIAATETQQVVQYGDDFYCRQRRLGQWFYCEKPKAETAAAKSLERPALTASERVKSITKKLDELRDRAILNPTKENVVAYIEYQNAQSERASLLADVWERTLIERPDLDYNQERPISTLGKQAWSDNREMVKSQTMLDLSKRYGIFYFYSGNCGACVSQSNILASLRDNYGLTILAVSEDGSPNVNFPDFEVNNGQRERMGLPGRITPTIALYDTVTRRTILIGSGVLAADEIVQRIYMLTQTQPGEDY